MLDSTNRVVSVITFYIVSFSFFLQFFLGLNNLICVFVLYKKNLICEKGQKAGGFIEILTMLLHVNIM